MANRVNVLEKVKEFRGKVNPLYDMTVQGSGQIYDALQGDAYGTIRNSFIYGYMQGVKATKAEQRKKKVGK